MVAGESTLVDVEIVLRVETADAYGVEDPNSEELIWLPKSQCEVQHRFDKDTTATMPEWLAMKKGLI